MNTPNNTVNVLILTCILLTSVATAQWSTQSPLPTHLDVRGTAAATSQRVFIATDDNSFDNGGSLFESVDGGLNWVQRDIPTSLSSPLNGIFFFDSNRGWVFGNENYRTTDGGSTWTALPFLGSAYFMKFYTAEFGLATGNFGRYVSHDGGLTWEASPQDMSEFDFADSQIGLGASATGIYRTIDAGTTFTLVHAGDASTVVFLSDSVAVGIVDSGFVRSTDGGVTWTAVASADGRSNLTALSAGVVLAWGRAGDFPDYDDRVLRSTDGGQTWADLGEVMANGVLAFTPAGTQTVVASDLNGNMFFSSDIGQSWAQTFASPGPHPGYLSSSVPAFSGQQTGYFGYGAGFIIKTTDGGATWLQISSGTGQSLNDIDRFPNGNLIAVGENGTLLTSNGTSPWIMHEAFTSSGLAAIHVVGPGAVVTVDGTGRVYRSSDGGESWVSGGSAIPGLSQAEDLFFTTLLDGWVIGQGFGAGVLYHTSDGGDSWTPVPDLLGAYIAVDVAGTNIWAANVTGLYYRSSDGGNSWLQGNLPGSPFQIQDMDFSNESIGYAVGSGGYVARSDDGGATWVELPSPNASDHFTDIYLVGANELWLSTSSGVAYYSASGGQSWAVLDIGSAGFGSFSAIAASPSGDAWTVGWQGYIEHFAGPPPPPDNWPPNASFSFLASGLAVYFTDTSSDPDGLIVNWSWDFGDGTTSTQQHPSHTFAEANTYIVRLTVTDDDGDSNATGRIVTVQPNPGGTFGDFTEVTPIDSIFVTPQDEDFWVITTAPADYDGDGDLDIAVFGYYVVYNQSVEDRLVLLTNNGLSGQGQWGFTYINVPTGTLTAGSSDLAWGDVDGDGDQDLALGTDGEAVIYRNDAGILTLTDTQLPAYWEDNSQADFDLRSITWADYDNDGDLDLLLPSVFDADSFAYRTVLMRNDGTNGTGGWTFTDISAPLSPTVHAQSAWADYDGDQDLDLLLVNIAPLTDEGFIRRYRNDGSGIFTGEDILGALTIEHGEAQWGDYDADGDLDILVAGNIKELDGTFTPMALRIYRNNNDVYDSLEVISCIPCEGWFDLTAATWADYDNDGDMDILLAGNYNSGSQIEGRAKVYTNTGGVFADSGNVLPAPRASGDRGGTFSWLDIDGEGDLDYFIAGQYFVPGGNGLVEAQMHVYRNDAAGQNAAPSAPSGLVGAVQDSGAVVLSWNSASDDHTPVAALTYDINLFRNGVPVAATRRLPEPGNVGSVNEWQLAGLPEGHYEWALRAVDAAYSGGPVAAGEFIIGSTAVGSAGASPLQFSIAQNYPNPFNPTTAIQFEVPKSGFVSLKVFDVLGREIALLVNEEKPPGRYSVQWDATGFGSGAYFYRLESNGRREIRKMLLMK